MPADSATKSVCKGKSLGKLAKALLPHEKTLLKNGQLKNVTHARSSSVWLFAPATVLESDESGAESSGSNREGHSATVLLYRVMGDVELMYLRTQGELPATQAYQSIQEGPAGREYSEKYLRGKKRVATSPTTVVEFRTPRALAQTLFQTQSKIEDGCISHGLGFKAGRTLHCFNAYLARRLVSWRIVTVKRSLKRK